MLSECFARTIMLVLHKRCEVFSSYIQTNLAEGICSDPKAWFAGSCCCVMKYDAWDKKSKHRAAAWLPFYLTIDSFSMNYQSRMWISTICHPHISSLFRYGYLKYLSSILLGQHFHDSCYYQTKSVWDLIKQWLNQCNEILDPFSPWQRHGW